MSSPIRPAFISKEQDTVGQALALLEVLQAKDSQNLVRISSELSEILADEKNFQHFKEARNLDELCEFIESKSPCEKMLRLPCAELLQESYPNLAKSAFL